VDLAGHSQPQAQWKVLISFNMASLLAFLNSSLLIARGLMVIKVAMEVGWIKHSNMVKLTISSKRNRTLMKQEMTLASTKRHHTQRKRLKDIQM
jgi:hypothetical protein